MQLFSWMKVSLLVGGLVLSSLVLAGCGDACSEAKSLCEDCSVEGEDCDAAFANASAEFCEEAVAAYEASCPDS